MFHKLFLVIICLTMMFVGSVYAQDEVGVESIVIGENSLGIGYVFDGYGTSAIMMLGPAVQDGTYDLYGWSNNYALHPYLRYSFDGSDRADIADLGAGVALKAALWSINIAPGKDLCVSVLGTADFDIEHNSLGDFGNRLGFGGMFEVPIVNW